MFFVKRLFLALDTQSSSKKCCVAFWLPAVLFLPEMLGHFGMIPRILTMIPVRENSEVVIIYPDQWSMVQYLINRTLIDQNGKVW